MKLIKTYQIYTDKGKKSWLIKTNWPINNLKQSLLKGYTIKEIK